MTRDEFRNALSELMEAEPGSPEEDKLEVFALLIEAYEQEHYPIDLPDPVEAIKFRMEQQGLSQKDMVAYLGSQIRVSEVLNRKRPLSLSMIRALHEGLGIPAEVLLQEPGQGAPEPRYDAMAARIAELEAERDAARAEAQARLESYNSEADEFNAGFDAYRAGLSPDDEPEVAHDVWRVGYAWAAYTHIARIAELEAACERALEGLRAPTHAANDHNCEDWPPGQGCRGCDGNELRKAVASEIAALLRGER